MEINVFLKVKNFFFYRVSFWFYHSGSAGVSQLTKITDEEFEALMNDFDPIEAPPGNYKIQPENQGFIEWKYYLNSK